MENTQPIIEGLIGQYGWMFLAAFFTLLFKNAVENFASGLLFLWGSDYNVDDEVYIGGTKKARIVRQSISKTVFYVYDTNRRLVVPNKSLYQLQIEKVLSGE